MHCVYCESQEILNRSILREDLAWAIPTNIPIVPGHLLILPRRCVSLLEELTSQELEALFSIRTRLRSALIKSFGATGFNYAWNEGKCAGQSVPHLHLHILPRKEGDAGVHLYEPRQFLYRPGSRESTPEAELVSVAEGVRRAM